MIAKIRSVFVHGPAVRESVVEVLVERGLPKFDIVGLAPSSTRESKNRVLSALKAAGHPLGAKKVTVNLYPSHLKKDGPYLDLAVALGLTRAMGLLEGARLDEALVVGELSLDGAIGRVPGILAIAEYARRAGIATLILPTENEPLARAVFDGATVAPPTFGELLAVLRGERAWSPAPVREAWTEESAEACDWSEVAGQAPARRVMEIAAAGRHHAMMVGPPGVGKTFIARRFGGILPRLGRDEWIERMRLCGAEEGKPVALVRTPHHSASAAGMTGGGKPFRPGEFALAHRGVLFLDEMVEFRRDVLEALRQPLESGVVTVARSEGVFTMDADFLLLAACNYCPCGAFGDAGRVCRCSPRAIEKYAAKLSAPIRDRIDLTVELVKPTWEEIWDPVPQKSSATARGEAGRARAIQARRNPGGVPNSKLSGAALRKVAALGERERNFLAAAQRRWKLSVRGLDKTLKVARTIADLAGSDSVTVAHLSEAMQYRAVKKWEF